jgi:hypothetical protein
MKEDWLPTNRSAILGLTWGGVTYPWSDHHVLVPLILGFFGLIAYVFYEANFVKEPTLPAKELTNRTSLVGYWTNFLHGLITIGKLILPR